MRTDKEEICRRMDEIHTTAMGYGRISKNLGLCGADYGQQMHDSPEGKKLVLRNG